MIEKRDSSLSQAIMVNMARKFQNADGLRWNASKSQCIERKHADDLSSFTILKQMLLTFTDSRLSNGGAEKTQKSSASRTRDFNNLESGPKHTINSAVT
jgi:hypothetical protein